MLAVSRVESSLFPNIRGIIPVGALVIFNRKNEITSTFRGPGISFLELLFKSTLFAQSIMTQGISCLLSCRTIEVRFLLVGRKVTHAQVLTDDSLHRIRDRSRVSDKHHQARR